MATVTFDHVYKRYGDVTAVSDFNLEIKDGEFMVFVGPSGCGKTTSLRMIAGLEEISEGELRIGDKVVNDVAPKDRDIAMVFQSYALYPHMSVRDNLAFGLKLRKVPKADIAKRINEAAGILQLEKLLDRKPKELSGGQRQRVALGRAIVREPAVFLMDEPLSNLDAKLRVQTRAEIARLHQRLGTTMVYVTHDQVEAMTMGQRIAVMSMGLLQQVGSPAGALRHAEEPVRRGLHRQPVDELHGAAAGRRGRQPRSRVRVLRPPGRVAEGGPRRRRHRRGGLPPGAPGPGRHRGTVRDRPGHGGRRRVPGQRGAPPRVRQRLGHRRDRGLGLPRPARRHRHPEDAARQAPAVRHRRQRGRARCATTPRPPDPDPPAPPRRPARPPRAGRPFHAMEPR